jgi:hypothetical protein
MSCATLEIRGVAAGGNGADNAASAGRATADGRAMIAGAGAITGDAGCGGTTAVVTG